MVPWFATNSKLTEPGTVVQVGFAEYEQEFLFDDHMEMLAMATPNYPVVYGEFKAQVRNITVITVFF